MDPFLFPGDIVIYYPFSKKSKSIRAGEIVIANHPLKRKKFIIKRVHDINGKWLDLRGDNEASSQDSRHFGMVHNQLICGIAEYAIRFSRKKNKSQLFQKIFVEVF